MSPKAAGLAAKQGYSNLKVYNEGMPAWKKAGHLAVVSPEDVAGWLDAHHVIVDVRPPTEVAKGHIASAVNVPLFQLLQLDRTYRAKQVQAAQAVLPGLKDKQAPVVLYSNALNSPEVPNAYKTVRDWGYKNVAVLAGGYSAWAEAGRPTATGKAPTEIAYVKRMAPGAVEAERFTTLVENGKAVVLDVRTPSEVATGKIAGAMAIPLEQLTANLARVPKDKPVLIHCASGARAGMAYKALKEQGFDNVQFLDESIEIDKRGDFCINCS